MLPATRPPASGWCATVWFADRVDDDVPRRGPKRRRTNGDDDRCRTAQRLRRLYEPGEESVAGCVLFAAAAALELVAHEPAERVKSSRQRASPTSDASDVDPTMSRARSR